MINPQPKCKKYTLSSDQVIALFSLLSNINLVAMERVGRINVVFDDISIEHGKVISDLFYDEEFAKEIE